MCMLLGECSYTSFSLQFSLHILRVHSDKLLKKGLVQVMCEGCVQYYPFEKGYEVLSND